MEMLSKPKLSAISSERQLLAHFLLHLFHWKSLTQIVVVISVIGDLKSVFLHIWLLIYIHIYHNPAIHVLILCKQISSPGTS